MRDFVMVVVLGLSIAASWGATAEIIRARQAYATATEVMQILRATIAENRKEPRDAR